ncbi:M15 family metallopeptidase [Pseudoxanthomonas daejeonensis]|uniref:M15 family metallopeptidase n=1 Tax=Pseudoxanthomonas daejeonensis TaxID=266062 RepID=UPI003CCD2342
MTVPELRRPAPDPRRRGLRAGCLLALAFTSIPALAAVPVLSPAADAAQAGMVEIREAAPGISVEMRYAGTDNFTGAVVPGYEAGHCYLLQPVAEALARVQATLHAEGLGLRIYDCYRPAHSVTSFMRWIDAPDDPALKARWYPNVDKSALTQGYIGKTSGHSRGATVDLTLERCDAAGCTPLDMGTPYDFFDPAAHTDAAGTTSAQRADRHRLRDAMTAEGFRNHPMEWWHYTLQPEPDPGTAYDFPVR